MKKIDTNVVPFGVQAYKEALHKSIETQIPFITITDTIYGITIPYDLKVCENILQRAYELKQRDHEGEFIRRIPLLVGSIEQLSTLKLFDDKAMEVVDNYYRHQCLGGSNADGVAAKLPTPTTLVLEQSPDTPLGEIYTAANDLSGVNSVGVRLVFPSDEYLSSTQHADTDADTDAETIIAQQLRRAIGDTVPVFASSANLTGDPYIHNVDHILNLFRGKIGTFLYDPNHNSSRSNPSSVMSLLNDGECKQLR